MTKKSTKFKFPIFHMLINIISDKQMVWVLNKLLLLLVPIVSDVYSIQ